MNHPKDTIEIIHGKTCVNVPLKIFKGDLPTIDEASLKEFEDIIIKRYPWLTSNSVNVIINKAKTVYLENRDMETKGASTCNRLASEGKYSEAVKHMEKLVEKYPLDPAVYYNLAKAYIDAGEIEKGRKAIVKANTL